MRTAGSECHPPYTTRGLTWALLRPCGLRQPAQGRAGTVRGAARPRVSTPRGKRRIPVPSPRHHPRPRPRPRLPCRGDPCGGPLRTSGVAGRPPEGHPARPSTALPRSFCSRAIKAWRHCTFNGRSPGAYDGHVGLQGHVGGRAMRAARGHAVPGLLECACLACSQGLRRPHGSAVKRAYRQPVTGINGP
ncbi:MAG: hypothetical protein J3K34DRAFT_406284 [Monoraphidium minutum]|nr:MAG: hypothetical protein J3K34DRAFT_406284 [Monoraphidium minutum]